MDARQAQLERVGVAVYCKNLIGQFSEYDQDFQFILLASLDSSAILSEFEDRYLDIRYVAPSQESSSVRKLLWYIKLPFLLNKIGCDLYFGPFIKFPFIDYKCKTVFTLHDAASITENHSSRNNFTKYLNYFFTKNWADFADGIICISSYCRDEFSNIFGPFIESKSRVIHHGLPAEFEGNHAHDVKNKSVVLRKYGNNLK